MSLKWAGVADRCKHGEYEDKPCLLCANEKLRIVKVNGSMKTVAALREIAEQFETVAFETDSSAHEVAAIAMRWAADYIGLLEGRLFRIERELKS